ncbi:MAG TPA: hypothetical protein VHT91_32075 [Kofleriaceae bacterium]|nr:hypothetical protein [Kofleriaceae bacterium]
MLQFGHRMQASSEQGHDDHVGFDIDDRGQVITIEVPAAFDTPGAAVLSAGRRRGDQRAADVVPARPPAIHAKQRVPGIDNPAQGRQAMDLREGLASFTS